MKIQLKKTVSQATTLVEFIASNSDISKSGIKKALNFGGGWLKPRGKGTLQRCRRATKELQPGDEVEFYYDDRLYKDTPSAPIPIQVTRHWGVWYKPANVVSQGTPYGDLGSMEYQVKQLSGLSQVFLIHRLDREAAGLMIFAYHKEAAAKLSELWRETRVEKIYQAEVHGQPDDNGRIDIPLDDKAALTTFSVAQRLSDTALVRIHLQTGRFHQIRRHFSLLGHPLVGDPQYSSVSDGRPMQLVAAELRFTCPFDKKEHHAVLPPELRLF